MQSIGSRMIPRLLFASIMIGVAGCASNRQAPEDAPNVSATVDAAVQATIAAQQPAPVASASPIVPPISTKAPINGDLISFSSQTYPYTISYPQAWTVSGSQILMGRVIDIFRGKVVSQFQTNVNILVQDQAGNQRTYSLDEWAQMGVSNTSAMGFRGATSPMPEISRLNVANHDARMITSFYPTDSHYAYEVVFSDNNQMWDLTLSVHASEHEQTLDIFRNMLMSFKLRLP